MMGCQSTARVRDGCRCNIKFTTYNEPVLLDLMLNIILDVMSRRGDAVVAVDENAMAGGTKGSDSDHEGGGSDGEDRNDNTRNVKKSKVRLEP